MAISLSRQEHSYIAQNQAPSFPLPSPTSTSSSLSPSRSAGLELLLGAAELVEQQLLSPPFDAREARAATAAAEGRNTSIYNLFNHERYEDHTFEHFDMHSHVNICYDSSCSNTHAGASLAAPSLLLHRSDSPVRRESDEQRGHAASSPFPYKQHYFVSAPSSMVETAEYQPWDDRLGYNNGIPREYELEHDHVGNVSLDVHNDNNDTLSTDRNSSSSSSTDIRVDHDHECDFDSDDHHDNAKDADSDYVDASRSGLVASRRRRGVGGSTSPRRKQTKLPARTSIGWPGAAYSQASNNSVHRQQYHEDNTGLSCVTDISPAAREDRSHSSASPAPLYTGTGKNERETAAQALHREQEQEQVKRIQTAISCTRCRSTHKKCDEQRPCKRCVRVGRDDCEDAPPRSIKVKDMKSPELPRRPLKRVRYTAKRGDNLPRRDLENAHMHLPSHFQRNVPFHHPDASIEHTQYFTGKDVPLIKQQQQQGLKLRRPAPPSARNRAAIKPLMRKKQTHPQPPRLESVVLTQPFYTYSSAGSQSHPFHASRPNTPMSSVLVGQ